MTRRTSIGEPTTLPGSHDRGWRRCTRSSPCPICGRTKFCSLTPDGTAVVCTKTESDHATRNGAWLHPIGESKHRHRRHLPVVPTQRADLELLARRLADNVTPERLTAFANALGVSMESLIALGVGWNGGAWSFPMTNARGDVVGIRYRNWRGEKWSERGGHEGVFRHLHSAVGNGPLLMPEGPTSSAAVLTLGFEVIGRPNDRGGGRYCCELALGRDVVVVADRDEGGQGQRGAQGLAHQLVRWATSVQVITPPVKDLRDWLLSGASRNDVDRLIAAAPMQRLQVRYRQ